MKKKLLYIWQTAISILGNITIDSYRRQIFSLQQEINNIKIIFKEEFVSFIMQQYSWGDRLVNAKFKMILEPITVKIKEAYPQISDIISIINNLEIKLISGDYLKNEKINLMKNYLNNEKWQLDNTKNSNNYVNEIQDSINRSDIFSFFFDFLEWYRNFVDQLNLEQLVAIFNLIGYGTLLSILISISIILLGDYLIDKLKLDIKYPKFAKYIKIKQSLNKHYLMLYFVLFYFIIIIFIIGNIYMLLLKYFL